jgi:hypothetical protein
MSVLKVLIKQQKKLTLYKKMLYNYNIDKYNYFYFYLGYNFDPTY